MKKHATRIGDKTAHGGVVVSGTPTVIICNSPAAREGDLHLCGITDAAGVHIGGVIEGHSETVWLDNARAARHSDSAPCMAVSIPAGGGGEGISINDPGFDLDADLEKSRILLELGLLGSLLEEVGDAGKKVWMKVLGKTIGKLLLVYDVIEWSKLGFKAAKFSIKAMFGNASARTGRVLGELTANVAEGTGWYRNNGDALVPNPRKYHFNVQRFPDGPPTEAQVKDFWSENISDPYRRKRVLENELDDRVRQARTDWEADWSFYEGQMAQKESIARGREFADKAGLYDDKTGVLDMEKGYAVLQGKIAGEHGEDIRRCVEAIKVVPTQQKLQITSHGAKDPDARRAALLDASKHHLTKEQLDHLDIGFAGEIGKTGLVHGPKSEAGDWKGTVDPADLPSGLGPKPYQPIPKGSVLEGLFKDAGEKLAEQIEKALVQARLMEAGAAAEEYGEKIGAKIADAISGAGAGVDASKVVVTKGIPNVIATGCKRVIIG